MTFTFNTNDLVWAKLAGFRPWPARIMNADAPIVGKLKKPLPKRLIFFFGTNNFAWIDEKDLKPYEEFREQMLQRKTNQREFLMALVDIATYLRDPREFAGLFKPFEVSEGEPAQDPAPPVEQKRGRKRKARE